MSLHVLFGFNTANVLTATQLQYYGLTKEKFILQAKALFDLTLADVSRPLFFDYKIGRAHV